MNAGLRSARQQPLSILLRRSYTTTTTAATTTTPTTITTDPIFPDPEARTDLATTTIFRIASAVVLSRPPQLTPELTAFERSYYTYQRRLHQRLSLPFTRYFYFKKETPADTEWKRKQRELGEVYTGFGKRAWADEVRVGEEEKDEYGYERLVASTVTSEDPTDLDSAPLPRRTAADEKGDKKSLDRELTRTLYLLVRTSGKDGRKLWGFPHSVLVDRENLREGAIRTLEEAAGVNMNTWFVGNVPIGYFIQNYHKSYTGDPGAVGKKLFFMKARIMAGQADLTDNKLGLDDFLWLTKEEIGEITGPRYFEAIKHMLVSR